MLSTLALAGPLTTMPAHAAITTAERVVVPPSGSVTLAGHGYGHGIGLSQWGSRGAALRGVGYQQILDFYYPGTSRVTQANTQIRVMITADDDDVVRVVAESGMTMSDGDSGPTPIGFSGETVTQWRILRQSAGFYLEGLVNGAWRRWSQTASPTFLSLQAPSDTIRLLLPNGTSKVYRGSIRSVPDGSVPGARTVNALPMESYLRSVVPAESPSSWPADALRSQAVAARTYASYERGHAGSRAWHTCDTTACQVYPGYRTYSSTGALTATHEAPSTDAAVSWTANQVRHYNGAPAFTQFSASNGGWSKAGSQPYLVARQDSWDAVDNPVHSWRIRITQGQLGTAFPQAGTVRSVEVRTRNGLGEWGGRVEQVVISGTRGTVTTTGAAFRTALGLRSDWWKITGSTRLDSDFSTNGRPDLVAQMSDGTLRLYEGTGTGGFGSVTQIGQGWGGMRIALRANDLTSDGRVDMLAVDGEGRLWRYPANGLGRFGPRVLVGTGWGSMTRIVAPGDIDRDGDADILATDAAGVMWSYRGNGAGGFGTKTQVGAGWGPMSNVVGGGDWNGDGHSDFLATDPTGRLLLYRGGGSGTFSSTQVGSGWSGMRLVSATEDWDGDSLPDLVAADSTGQLFLYRWNGSSFTGRVTIGTGWSAVSRLL
jgi:SpoIID/LytB domain protein